MSSKILNSLACLVTFKATECGLFRWIITISEVCPGALDTFPTSLKYRFAAATLFLLEKKEKRRRSHDKTITLWVILHWRRSAALLRLRISYSTALLLEATNNNLLVQAFLAYNLRFPCRVCETVNDIQTNPCVENRQVLNPDDSVDGCFSINLSYAVNMTILKRPRVRIKCYSMPLTCALIIKEQAQLFSTYTLIIAFFYYHKIS